MKRQFETTKLSLNLVEPDSIGSKYNPDTRHLRLSWRVNRMRDLVYYGIIFSCAAIIFIIWLIWFMDEAHGPLPLMFGICVTVVQLILMTFLVRALREPDIETLEVRGTNAKFASAFPFYFFALQDPPLPDFFYTSEAILIRVEFFLFQSEPELFSMRPLPVGLHILSAVYQDSVNASLYHATQIATVSRSEVEHLTNVFKEAGVLSHCDSEADD